MKEHYLVISEENKGKDSFQVNLDGGVFFSQFDKAKDYVDWNGGCIIGVATMAINGIGIFYPVPEGAHECVQEHLDHLMEEQ